jgi:hypothetical protein
MNLFRPQAPNSITVQYLHYCHTVYSTRVSAVTVLTGRGKLGCQITAQVGQAQQLAELLLFGAKPLLLLLHLQQPVDGTADRPSVNRGSTLAALAGNTPRPASSRRASEEPGAGSWLVATAGAGWLLPLVRVARAGITTEKVKPLTSILPGGAGGSVVP